MASLFGNHNRVKLVDEEEDLQRSTTRLGALLKPNRRRLINSKLSKDDSFTSFDNESLFSRVDGSGEAESLASHALIAHNARPLHLSQSGSASVGSFESHWPQGVMKESGTPLRSRRSPLSLGASIQPLRSLFTEVDKGDTTFNSKFQRSEASLSFFDPDSSRTSFFQEDEAEDLEGSGRPSLKSTPGRFPVSQSISKDIDFGSLQLDAEEADEIISPITASPFAKPKIGSTRNSMSSLKLRATDFSSEDFKSPSTRSDRSRSRRSLPSNLARSHSESPAAATTSLSLRQNRRTALRATMSDSAKCSPSPSSTLIDMTKAGEVAKEKLKGLRSNRNTMQMASIRRSASRNDSIKDKKTIDGVLSNILGDKDDDFKVATTAADGSRRSNRSSRRTPSTPDKKMVDIQHSFITAGELLLNDVDFPELYFSPTGAKKEKIESNENTQRSRKGIETINQNDIERSTRGSLHGSTRRAARSLDRHIQENPKNTTEDATHMTPDSPMKESVGGKSRSSRGRRTSKGEEGGEERRSRKSISSEKCKKSIDTDHKDFAALVTTQDKVATLSWETEAIEGHQTSRKLRANRRHPQPPREGSESKKNSESGFSDFALPSTPKAVQILEKFSRSGCMDLPSKSEDLGFDEVFGSFKAQNPGTITPNHGPVKSSVRERAKVDPKIVPVRIALVIPKHLKQVGRPDDSLDNSGHSNFTKATNWNWDDDNWNGQTEANHPATITEEDEEVKDAFGSPSIPVRKGVKSSFQKSSSFSPALEGFIEIRKGTQIMDRSVASAPNDDLFGPLSLTSRELHRASSRDRTPRRTDRQVRRSDPFN